MKKIITTALLISLLFFAVPAKAATQEEINTQIIQIMLQIIDLLKQQIVALLTQQATPQQVDTFTQQQEQLTNQIIQLPMPEPKPAPAPTPAELKQTELQTLNTEETTLKSEKIQKWAIFNVATESQIASCKVARRQQLRDSGYPRAIGISGQKFDTLTDKQIEDYLAQRPATPQQGYLECVKPTGTAYKTQEQKDAYARILEADKRLNEIEDRKNALK